MIVKVKFKKLNDYAITPEYATEFSAGMDLSALIRSEEASVKINPGKTVKIGTGLAVEIPSGFFGAIFARSGLATKRGLRPSNCVGVIDADYRGEIIVALHNDSNKSEVIYDGDRIAQLVIIPYVHAELSEVAELSDTERGSGGFGSTGINTPPKCSKEYNSLSMLDDIMSMFS